MTNNFSLDDIREAADKKYGSTFITVAGEDVELVNVLRLSKDKRNELSAIQESADKAEEGGEDVDIEEVLAKSLRLVAKSSAQADRLINAIDGDLALLSQVFEVYSSETNLGEASGSES